MPHGTWTTTSGGGVGAALAVLAPAVVVCAVAYVTAQAVAAIPVWVWVVVPAAVFAVTMAAAVGLARHTRRGSAEIAAVFAARRAELAALEEARQARARQHTLDVAAASAPHIQTVVLDRAALEAMVRGYPPATVITDTKEIPR
jgi:hypothetical protein